MSETTGTKLTNRETIRDKTIQRLRDQITGLQKTVSLYSTVLLQAEDEIARLARLLEGDNNETH